MPKKLVKPRPDVAETAFRVMQEAIGEAPKTLPPIERATVKPRTPRKKRAAKPTKPEPKSH